jgi:nicotinamide riboside kinase
VRIGLIGGECTGKSTLAHALAAALPGCVVEESLRAFVDDHGRPPLQHEQAALMAEQQAAESAAAETCPHPALVSDPAPLMTAVYSQLYFDDDSLVAPAVEHARRYDLVVWCDDDLPWSPDGAQRDGEAFRTRAAVLIDRLVRDRLVPQGIPVLRVRGSVEERLAAVAVAWQPGPPSRPT